MSNPAASQYAIRAAREHDLSGLMRTRSRAIDQITCQAYQRSQIVLWRDADVIDKYRELVRQNCLWVLGPVGQPLASAGLRLDSEELVAVFVEPASGSQSYARRLVSRVEQAAASYGITRLLAEASLNATGLYQRLGYQAGRELEQCDRLGLPCLEMHKNLRRRQTRYQQQVLKTLRALGIEQTYGIRHKLPMQPPPARLVSAGQDCFDRPQRLTPASLRGWHRMQSAARADGIDLVMVSAYRDLAYQTGIIERKLARGQAITEILKVSAAPGFSEHHTGRALDLNTPGRLPLENAFSTTTAYAWLTQHAGDYGFVESYPQDNMHGINWEPWHWCYQGLSQR